MPNKYFSIDGVATYVHHTGATTLPEVAPDTSRGYTVVCLHGAGENGAIFAPLLEQLAGQHSPIAFDQPGHARSGGLDSLGSIERMAEFTLAFCAKLGFERPVLLGHSMGGAVALACALAAPERVRALVLSSAAARFPIPAERLEHARRITEGKARNAFDRDLYAKDTPPEVMRRGFMDFLKTDPRVTYGDYLACRDLDAEAGLASVAVPTLVMRGAEERSPLREGVDDLAQRIPGARFVEIPNACHALPHEQPEALAEAVLGFLAELSS